MLDLAALVLAGGQSSRMGSDKALLLWEGIPLLQRVCTVAAACCEVVYVLTPWQERYQSMVSAVGWLREPQPGLGALAALAQALPEIPASWVLVLACDLPQLHAAVIQGWSARLPHVSDHVLAVVPWHNDRWSRSVPSIAPRHSPACNSLSSRVDDRSKLGCPRTQYNPLLWTPMGLPCCGTATDRRI